MFYKIYNKTPLETIYNKQQTGSTGRSLQMDSLYPMCELASRISRCTEWKRTREALGLESYFYVGWWRQEIWMLIGYKINRTEYWPATQSIELNADWLKLKFVLEAMWLGKLEIS